MKEEFSVRKLKDSMRVHEKTVVDENGHQKGWTNPNYTRCRPY